MAHNVPVTLFLDFPLPFPLVFALPSLWCFHFNTHSMKTASWNIEVEIAHTRDHTFSLHDSGGNDVSMSSVRY